MKGILVLKYPERCFDCELSTYNVDAIGDKLLCIPLTNIHECDIEGDYFDKRHDCPIILEKEYRS